MIFELILLILLLWFVVHTVITHVRTPKVRASADRIITGKQPATEDQINKHITWLLSRNSWLHGRTEQDLSRIERLRSLRDEMLTPQA